MSSTTCSSVDTYMQLYAPDRTTLLGSDDDSGVSLCSLLDPTVAASVRRLAPGTYYVNLRAFSATATITQYNARVTAVATCGNGIREGSETCDDGNTAGATAVGRPARSRPATSARAHQPVAHACGDGVVQASEACDDGNTTATDGCSATAPSRPGTPARAAPSVCHLACGDGVLQTGEICDDGNSVAGDGCSTTCTIEPGSACAGTPSVCSASCGDGIVSGAEACDDGNAIAGDGCTTCAIDTGFACSGTPSVCDGICGDGVLHGTETCDDGNVVSGDCCSATCRSEVSIGTLLCEIEPNNTAATATGPTSSGGGLVASIRPAADVDYFSFTIGAYSDVRLETFDTTSSTTCTAIDTYMQLFAPDRTTLLGTDDDSGINACSLLDPAVATSVRRLAPGTYYVLVRAFSATATIAQYNARVTVVSTCANGILEGSEACDDGNSTAGDGCAVNCAIETGYGCTGTPSVCTLNCGNGTLQAGEGCDDGNRTAGDGCSATCAVEPGYACTGAPSVCATSCGDGLINGADTCDDGNLVAGDGCSALCQVEPNRSCTGAPSVCVAREQQCNDGVDNDADGLTDAADTTAPSGLFHRLAVPDRPSGSSGPPSTPRAIPDATAAGITSPVALGPWAPSLAPRCSSTSHTLGMETSVCISRRRAPPSWT